MNYRVSRRWTTNEAGLLVDAGQVLESQTASTTTVVHLKGLANEVRRVFADNNVVLAPGAYITHLLASAEAVSDAFLTGGMVSPQQRIQALYLHRIADAIVAIEHVDCRRKFLRRFARDNLNLNSNMRSEGKDLLWELELWMMLTRRGFDARLAEPPDIVVTARSLGIGIACKKTYSQNNFKKALSDGVSQTTLRSPTGLVAFNIDSLLPDAQFVRARTKHQAMELFNSFAEQFRVHHEQRVASYVRQQRIAAVLISVGGAIELTDELPALQNARSWLVWTFEGMADPHATAIRQLRRIATGPVSE